MEIGTQKIEAGLYVVATPLGNLRDISLRALDVLAAADFVYCEDTRVSGKLFAAYGLDTPRRSYHEHNAAAARPKLLAQLEAGSAVALISDAGTPAISDPGLNLVQAVRAAGYRVHIVPGASAVVAALSGAGFPTDKFYYVGFLPRQATGRRKALMQAAVVPATLVIYESPHRLAALMGDIATTLDKGESARQICVAREMTKRFEEMIYGTAAELAAQFTTTPPKGEMVVLIAPPLKPAPALLDDETILAALETASLRDVVQTLMAQTGLPRKAIYQRTLDLSQKKKT